MTYVDDLRGTRDVLQRAIRKAFERDLSPETVTELKGSLRAVQAAIGREMGATAAPVDGHSTLHSPDSLKMIRETLCVAQTYVGLHCASWDGRQYHIDHLQRLIDDIDRQRPLGPDGKHSDRHTDTCGCEDR